MSNSIENSVKSIITNLGENPSRQGLLNTPKRVRQSLEFLTSGYNKSLESTINQALFESKNNEMVVIRDIEFYSLCEHHLLPFFGRIHCAYIPDKKVIGLSKIPRIIEIYARRLQIQENLTEQIADALEFIKPKGVGVVIEARHLCMEMRGVQKANATTTTSALRGLFLKDEKTRKEFFALINAAKQVRF